MKNLYRSMLSVLLLSAPLFAFGCAAQAGSADEASQTQAVIGQTAQIPTAHAKPEMVSADARFAQWIVRPDGKLSSMLLDDGSIVHVRSDAVKDPSALKAGDAVHVEGFKFGKDSSNFGMAKVTKDGNVIVDAPKMGDLGKMHAMKGDHGNKKHDGVKPEGKEHDGAKNKDGKDGKKWGLDESKLQTVSSTATIARVLPGRHGKGVGMLILSDGTVAFAPHKVDDATVATLGTLKKGDSITVSGLGGSYPQGKSLVLKSITMPSGKVEQI